MSFIDFDEPSKGASGGFVDFDKPDTQGDFVRGAKVALGQTIPIAKGAVGLLGATAENIVGQGGIATKVKDWGLSGFEEGMKKLQPLQHDNDDVTVAWERAKDGDLGAMVDWAQYALGYGLAQVAETAAVGVAGAAVGGVAGGGVGAAPGAVAGLVEKEAAKGLIRGAVEREIARRAGANATEASIKAATKSLARDVGAVGSLTAYNVAVEAGSIYPDAVEEAKKQGRELTGSDLARVWGAASIAGASETIPDVIGLAAISGRLKAAIPGQSRLARAGVGALGGAGLEAGQEAFQTATERFGARKELGGDEAVNEYINAAAMAALPGGVVGGAAGLLHSKTSPLITPPGPADHPLAPLKELAAPVFNVGGTPSVDVDQVRRSGEAQDAADALYRARDAEELRVKAEFERLNLSRTPDEAIGAAMRATSGPVFEDDILKSIALAEKALPDISVGTPAEGVFLAVEQETAAAKARDLEAMVKKQRDEEVRRAIEESQRRESSGIPQTAMAQALQRAYGKRALAGMESVAQSPAAATPGTQGEGEVSPGRSGEPLSPSTAVATAAPADVRIFGKPLEQLTTRELEVASKSHRMSGFREAARAELERRTTAVQSANAAHTTARGNGAPADQAGARAPGLDGAGTATSPTAAEAQRPDAQVPVPGAIPAQPATQVAEQRRFTPDGREIVRMPDGQDAEIPHRDPGEPPSITVDTSQREAAAVPAVRQQLYVERGGKRFPVATLKEASEKWHQFRDAGMRQGGHAADMGHGARIVDQNGTEVANISWNGKVWPPGEWHSGMKPLVGKTFEEERAAFKPAPVKILGKTVEQLTKRELETAEKGARQRAQREAAAAELERRRDETSIEVPPDMHEQLRKMAQSAVWWEQGGRAAAGPDADTQRKLNEEGRGRTHWVGMPDWARGFGMNKDDFAAAVEKAITGKPLGKKQRLAVQAMIDEVKGYRDFTAEMDAQQGVGQEEKAVAAQTLLGSNAPDDWNKMSFDEQEAHIDSLLGPSATVGQVQARPEETPPQEVRPAERQPGEDDDLAAPRAAGAAPSKTTEAELRVGDVVMVVGGKYDGTVRELRKLPAKAHDGFVVSDRLGDIRVGQVKFIRRPESARPSLELSAQTAADLKAKDQQAATGKVEERAAAVRDRNDAILTAPEGTAPPRSAEEQKVPTQQPGLFGSAVAALRTAADELEKAAKPAEQKPAPAATKPAGERLTDAGENLWANRRNFTSGATTWDDVKGLNDTLKVKQVVKAKVWPKPNYEEMVGQGLQPIFARFIKHVYDGISTTPAGKSDEQLQRYISAVGKVRDAAFEWAKDGNANQSFLEEIARQAKLRMERRFSISSLSDKVDITNVIIDRVWPESKGDRYRFRNNAEVVADARALGGNRALKAMQFTIDDAVEAMKDIEKGWPASQESWQRQGYKIVKGDGVTVSFHEGKRTRDDSPYVSITWNHPSERSYIQQQTIDGATSKNDTIVAEVAKAEADKMKDGWLLIDKRGRLVKIAESEEAGKEAARELVKRESKGSDMRGMNIAAAEREGPDRREKGDDVTPDRLMKEFGFRGVNFGREGWINQAERQAYLNHAFDGLLDLAEILGVPPKALSLNGMLGIAFGAQGRGGNAAAHFVPGHNEINLTKTMGAGTLAHEWGHALDHYFATLGGLSKSSEPYMSAHSTLSETHTVRDSGMSFAQVKRFGEELRPEVIAAFKEVVETMEKRSMTPAEVEAREASYKNAAMRSLETWIQHFRKDIERAEPAKLPAFDKLAERMRKGDLGEGHVKVGQQHLSEVVGQVKALVKGMSGTSTNIASNWNGLENNARSVAFKLSQKEATKEHIPQTTNTTYAGDSTRKDQEKKGKPYWRTRWEMFARAFETWVASQLADRAQNNTFLSEAHIRAEMKDRTGEGFAQPYPRGEDRERINTAIGKLVDAIETKETDKGTAMFSRAGVASTPEFKRWFGDSKVVDENGKPLVVYHGTAADFDEFKTPWLKKLIEGGAHFFTESPWEASDYALERAGKRGGANVLPVYLKIENPGTPGGAKGDGLIVEFKGPAAGMGRYFVAYESSQIKSAIGNRGTFDPNDPDIRFARGQRWYSALERALEASKQGTAPVMQWKATLKSMKGVSPEELEWSGVMDWLDTREGKVAKDEILGFLQANGVKVEETVLSQDETARTSELDRLKVELDALGYDVVGMSEVDGAFGVIERGTDMFYSDTEDLAEEHKPRDELPKNVREKVDRLGYLLELREDPHADLGGNTTRYDRYTMPGGENYRELLLTLPEQTKEYGFAKWLEDNPQWKGDQEAMVAYERSTAGKSEPDFGPAFRSSHFDQPNILAHVRFNERTDADGKKVLFIEEIQSDWAQKGKREGFRGKEVDHATRDELRKQLREILDRDGRSEAAREIETELRDMERRTQAVPLAPFVGKTDAWVGLALKRMISWAAENGFDRVAWTNGAQQVDRYDLSKHIDRLTYTPSTNLLVGTKSGRGLIKETVEPKDLADYVGKDAAEKLLATALKDDGGGISYHELSGLDLKLGGEGMLGFYDDILPKVANKLLGKLGGARVDQRRMAKTTDKDLAERKELHQEVINYLLGRSTLDEFIDNTGVDMPRAELERMLEAHIQPGPQMREFAGEIVRTLQERHDGQKGTMQPGFDITPQMRELAAQGMPLFARGDRQSPGLTRQGLRDAVAKAFGDKAAERLLDENVLVAVDRQEELPAHIVPLLRRGDTVFGFYDPRTDKTYAVLENLSAGDIRGLVIHEVGVHYGFERMLGAEKYAKVMKRLDVLRKGGNKAVREAYESAKAEAARPEHIEEETLAYLVQHHPALSFVQEIISAIKAFLYREFGIGASKLTEADMVALARSAVLRAGGKERIAQAAPAFHRAFHGTPYDFERFSTDHIGKGEGAQAFGWGLYFSGKKEVAEHYRTQLSGSDEYRQVMVNGIPESSIYNGSYPLQGQLTEDELKHALTHIVYYVRLYKDANKGLAEARAIAEKGDLYPANSEVRAAQKLFAAARVTVKDDVRFGKTYEVELAPKEAEYLDWDTPIGTQSETVKAALERAGFDTKLPTDWRVSPGMYGSEAYRTVARMFERSDEMWAELGTTPAGRGSRAYVNTAEAASRYLEKLGIPGITYKGPTSGERNYVVFDDKHVNVASKFSRAIREGGIPRNAVHIASSRNTNALKNHPDYKAAKGGDFEAAARLVRDLVSKEDLERASAFGKGTLYAWPHAQERDGYNAIPAMLAGFYASKGGRLAPVIVQTNRAYHTGAKAMERMLARPLFDGDVVRGGRYVLVDDVSTMGGTLAELADHIHAGGGEVVGTAVLADSSRTPTMAPSKQQISEIESRYGEAVREIFRVDPAALTAAEAGYVLNFRDADSLRARASSAERERGERLRAKGVQPPEVVRGDADFTPRFSRAGWIDQQPADTQEALRKAGVWHRPPTLKDRIAEWKKDWAKRVRQGVFDQFDPIKQYDYRAYLLARLTRGADAALDGILHYGTVFLDGDGAVDVNFEKGGFIGVMSELKGEHDRFLAWVIGNRAERLKAEGREHNFSDADIAKLKTLSQGSMPDGSSRTQAYAKARASLDRYNRSVLDIAERAALIDGAARAAWEKDFYVPFYRLMEEEDRPIPQMTKGLVNQYAFKVLKGGERELGDPLENVMRNWSHLLDASLKNQAARESLLAAEKVGVAIEADEETARQMAKSMGQKHGAVSFVDQGKARWFVVEDPFLLDAMRSIGFTGFGGAGMKVLQKFKRWLTMGVTVSPTFRIRNVIRDSLQMIGTNPASYNVLDNILTGWKATKEGTPEFAHILAGGGVMRFGTLLEGDRAEHVKRLIEAGIDDKTVLDTPAKVKAMLREAWDWWQHVGDRAENVNRAALYKKLRADGKSHLEASFGARDTMDFSMQGTWGAIRFLAQTVPFMNARLQGLYKLGRGAAEDPRRFGIVVGGASIASMALLLAYKDDDDWKQREDWDRETYWWFKVGDKAFRIPKPFEIGAVATLAERGLELMATDQLTGKQFASRVFSIVGQQLSMNPVPQLAMPLIEVYANRDSFTDRPIETMGMERLSKEQRVGPGTSPTAQLLGKNGFVSPVQIDHLVRGYFGWLGSHIVSTTDLALRPAMGLPPEPAWKIDQVLVAGDFVKDLPAYQSKYVTHLYDQMKEVQEAMADLRHLQKIGATEQAAKVLEEKRDKIGLYRLYTHAERHLTNVNTQIKLVQERPGDAEQKRQRLDELYAVRNRIAKVTEEAAARRRAQ